MGQWLGYMDGFEEDGHPRSVGLDELHTDTEHPQGVTAADLEVDFVGSSTVQQINPLADTFTNAPSQDQKKIPVGAKVDNGIIII